MGSGHLLFIYIFSPLYHMSSFSIHSLYHQYLIQNNIIFNIIIVIVVAIIISSILLLLLLIVMEFSEMQLNDDAFELCIQIWLYIWLFGQS